MRRLKQLIPCSALALSLAVLGGEAMAEKKKKKGGKKKDAAGEGAGDEGGGESYRAPYGMAGCGLGSLVLKENTKGSQIGAGLLNATGTQTFGITTGSSNCVMTKDDVALQQEQEVYVTANLTSLSEQAAQGDGEHLQAFAQVLGCHGNEEYPEFQAVSRASYPAIFATNLPRDVLARYLTAVRANDKLAKGCVRLVTHG